MSLLAEGDRLGPEATDKDEIEAKHREMNYSFRTLPHQIVQNTLFQTA